MLLKKASCVAAFLESNLFSAMARVSSGLYSHQVAPLSCFLLSWSVCVVCADEQSAVSQACLAYQVTPCQNCSWHTVATPPSACSQRSGSAGTGRRSLLRVRDTPARGTQSMPMAAVALAAAPVAWSCCLTCSRASAMLRMRWSSLRQR